MPLTRFPYGVENGPLAVYTGAADAVLFPGTAILKRASAVDSATLATPVAGRDYETSTAPGDDDKFLHIINGAAEANTVTTAAGKILDGTATPKDTITFAADIGAQILLKAYNGFWIVVSSTGVTLTEV